jgi:UDP-glucose 4-epimerase
VVQAFMALMETDAAAGQVLNVGGTEEISIRNLAEKIIGMTASASRIEYIPYEKAFGKDFEDMQRRVPGIEKIHQLIGFDPKTSLEEILRQIIASKQVRQDFK